MDKTEQNKLPAVASDYIDAVMKNMRYRRTVRQEVRQELIDHFTDALADCQTDAERNDLAKNLIDGFGDVELLAILLRRAKKRCRPLWRTAIVRLFQTAGVLVLLFAIYVGWFFSGKPVVTTNYVELLNRQVRPVADDSLNAAPYYLQAVELYKDIAQEAAFDRTPRRLSSLTPPDRQILLEWLTANQAPLEWVRQGNMKPHYWPSYSCGEGNDTALISVLLPHVNGYRKLAQLLCWQALLDAEAGKKDEAFDSLMQAYRFGLSVRGQNTTLIDQLVSAAIVTLSTSTTRTLLDEHSRDVDDEWLKAAGKRLTALIEEANFEFDLTSEKLFVYDEAQRCFTASRFGRSHLYLPRVKEISASELNTDDHIAFFFLKGFQILFTHPDKDQTIREVEQLHAELQSRMKLTPATMRSQMTELQQKLDDIAENNLFLAQLSPAFYKVIERSHRTRIDCLATLTIVAALQYRNANGRVPESLQTLVQAGLLPQVPIDPYSDAPLVYQQAEDGFTLYSVGLNFTDDGGIPGRDRGQWEDNGDTIFWPVPRK